MAKKNNEKKNNNNSNQTYVMITCYLASPSLSFHQRPP